MSKDFVPFRSELEGSLIDEGIENIGPVQQFSRLKNTY